MKLGFLGLGMMGMPIVKNILAKGESELYFFARRAEVIQKTNALGGKQVKSLKELGKTCDIIFVLLGNGEQCVDCILGDNGILSEMEHGMIVISSTIGVRFMEHIYKSCNEKGIHLIDAPISGGTAKASEGTLTMMLSGEEDAIAVLRPLLEAAGTSMDNVVKTTVFIKEMNDFGTINEVYKEFFTTDFPARSCVEVARLPKDVLLEIEAVAVK